MKEITFLHFEIAVATYYPLSTQLERKSHIRTLKKL